MATPIAQPALPSGLARTFAGVGDALASLMSLVEVLDRFIATQRRAGQDRLDLAAMSDRELADIGLPRASIDVAARGAWTRDTML